MVAAAAAGASLAGSFSTWAPIIAKYGTAAAGLGGLIGGVGSLFSRGGSGVSPAASALIAQYQAQQEEKRMKNAHQWEVQDLIKAGMNPALTAAAPTAGAIAGNSGHAGNIMANLMNTMQTGRDNSLNRLTNSALSAAGIFNKIREIENDAGLKEAQINNTDADTTTKVLNNQLINKYGDAKEKQNLANAILEGEAKKAQTAAARAQTEKTKQEININKPVEIQNTEYGKFLKENPTAAAIINATDNVLDRGSKLIGFVSNFMGSKAALSAAKNFRHVKTQQRVNYYNNRGELSGTRETMTIRQ